MKQVQKAPAILTAAVFGAFMTFASFAAIPVAFAHECPQEGCFADGRMTGGGRLDLDDRIVTHGFELHCSVDNIPNNLEVNWDGGNRFHLDELTNVKCIDDPSINPHPPKAGFDLMEGGGTGTYNGEEGATIYFVLTDAGEPGSSDTARLLIRDAADNIVLDVRADLDQGNHQAHNVNNP
jgi:hypothetical protein